MSIIWTIGVINKQTNKQTTSDFINTYYKYIHNNFIGIMQNYANKNSASRHSVLFQCRTDSYNFHYEKPGMLQSNQYDIISTISCKIFTP